MSQEQQRIDSQALLAQPNGIILVTGPTGSGKSTSLYCFLSSINSVQRRIITIEEPVEYRLPGVSQIDVKPEIDLTFAKGLRHILRQDPNVVMVGEIRDFETAEIAIRAAMTGHLVFSTLHTNDAVGGITRLLDMDVEPFLLASRGEGIHRPTTRAHDLSRIAKAGRLSEGISGGDRRAVPSRTSNSIAAPAAKIAGKPVIRAESRSTKSAS